METYFCRQHLGPEQLGSHTSYSAHVRWGFCRTVSSLAEVVHGSLVPVLVRSSRQKQESRFLISQFLAFLPVLEPCKVFQSRAMTYSKMLPVCFTEADVCFIFLNRFNFLRVCIYMCLCLCTYAWSCVQRSKGSVRFQRSWSHGQFWAPQCECWKSNSNPLHVQQALLTAEHPSSPHLLSC